MKGGDPDVPIVYRVKRLNVTNNFEAHSISANQYGQTIFSCQASYHRPEKSSLFHERAMPDAPPPDTLPSMEDNFQKLLQDPRLPEKSRQRISESLKTPFLIDVREVTPIDVFQPEKRPPDKKIWMKTKLSLENANINVHRCFAAFASDWGLASASLLPHAIHFGHPNLKVCDQFNCNCCKEIVYV